MMNNRYEIVVCWSVPDGCFLAEVPELPKLITDGATRLEALQNAETMIDAYIVTARREAWPLPEHKGRLALPETIKTQPAMALVGREAERGSCPTAPGIFVLRFPVGSG